METAVNGIVEQSPDMPVMGQDENPADVYARLREALVAFWESDCQDAALRERILAFPDGAAALAKGERIREAFRPFAETGISVEEFLREKHAEARRKSLGPDC